MAKLVTGIVFVLFGCILGNSPGAVGDAIGRVARTVRTVVDEIKADDPQPEAIQNRNAAIEVDFEAAGELLVTAERVRDSRPELAKATEAIVKAWVAKKEPEGLLTIARARHEEDAIVIAKLQAMLEH